MFQQNKYTRWYFEIIEKRKQNQVLGYTESHHIIPSALGGLDDDGNRVRLMAREHLICHLLLIRMTSGRDRHLMVCAAKNMCRTSKNQERHVSSRVYEMIRKLHSKSASELLTGIQRSEETKKKISLGKSGKKRSVEDRLAMSKRQIGRKWTKESTEKRTASVLGSKRTEETKKKMSEARKQYWERKRESRKTASSS